MAFVLEVCFQREMFLPADPKSTTYKNPMSSVINGSAVIFLSVFAMYLRVTEKKEKGHILQHRSK